MQATLAPPADLAHPAEQLRRLWQSECPLEQSPAEQLAWLTRRSGLPASAMADWQPAAADTQLIPYAEGQRRLCLALRTPGQAPTLVLGQPFDADTRLWLEGRLRGAGLAPTQWFVALAEDVQAFYGKLERDLKALDGPQDSYGDAPDSDDADGLQLSLANISEDDSPVVRFVNSTLYDALKARASDIHLESTARGLSVKYRLDGVLHSVVSSEGRDYAARVISRIKVVANLDITERRLPQDGRLKLRAAGRSVDVRVSIIPSLFGEDAVLRILDRYQIAADDRLNLTHLGFNDEVLGFIRRMGRFPYGLFLVTGPTGSGKTTTLYGVLTEVNTGLDKIVTIEDPVEYQLGDVLQIPVNEAKGLTFARGLRAILRHDPDKIMVGEMRDAETAQIAVQAALTGHQVYATVHANHVFDVIGRLSTMGVDAYNLVAALNGVLAQRLVRKICPQCAAPEAVSEERRRDSRLPEAAAGWTFMRGMGCAHCRGTGYKGRRAIGQALLLDIGLKSLIAERASPSALRQAAFDRGLTTLRDAALVLVAQGATTLEEADRVTALEE